MSTILPDPREGGLLGAPPKELGVRGGTGFFISTDGGILTNNHVVERCLSVQISVGGPALHEAQVKGTDKENDLALVYSDLKPTAVPALRTGVASGEAVAIYGFPLPGILAQSGVFTAGNVSALAGLGGDTTKLQMSSPLQPGNSGGPLLDQSGNVVGVAEARLMGQLIENVNFAIKAEVAISFLKANNAQPNTAASTTPIGPAEIAERAKLYTVQVICHPQPSRSASQATPQQKRAVVRLTQPIRQGAAPDMHFGDASPQDVIPKDTVFEIPYVSLYRDCRRRISNAGLWNVILCPITYNNHVEWVNAFYLDTGDGRLSCVMDPRSFGCDQAQQ